MAVRDEFAQQHELLNAFGRAGKAHDSLAFQIQEQKHRCRTNPVVLQRPVFFRYFLTIEIDNQVVAFNIHHQQPEVFSKIVLNF